MSPRKIFLVAFLSNNIIMDKSSLNGGTFPHLKDRILRLIITVTERFLCPFFVTHPNIFKEKSYCSTASSQMRDFESNEH